MTEVPVVSVGRLYTAPVGTLPNDGTWTDLTPAFADRISENEMLMQIAEVAAKRATCNRMKVGAVLAREGRPLSIGRNGAPSGARHCGSECFPGGPRCETSIHAEANAILWAARVGVSIEGSIAFVTLNPCPQCASLLVQVGVSRVFFREFYRDSKGNDLLESAGIPVRQLG